MKKKKANFDFEQLAPRRHIDPRYRVYGGGLHQVVCEKPKENEQLTFNFKISCILIPYKK
jgi:hypothetical protein